MPIYEYKCKKCGHTFSVLQPMSACRTGAQCPGCGGSETERVISRFASGKGENTCSSRGPFT